ncbi:MAG TPA: NAD-dependent epimerase/dehydratase family protein [Chloroflexota bacterium]|nr:NAD-dependent epimerase/dehydratase family protein [Chloroflexota bacterium]
MRALITGGAGFIGSNLARYLASRGHAVRVLDNLARPGSERNLAWLRETLGGLDFVQADSRDAAAVARAAAGCDAIFHFAAQVAVTSSVTDPVHDFEVNARGTLNVLEAARQHGCAVFYTSTNKVYGGMDDVPVVELPTRYAYADLPLGASEQQPLDFHSPYGCSKGAADQYVHDYARIYGLRTVVFRMSCIYGTRQFGNEDQGWVAHFLIAAVLGRPITIYGDGKQVRDLLFVDDLVRAFELAWERLDTVAGRVYNIGGGPANALAIWTEFGPLLAELLGRPIPVEYGPWRPGDQKVYVTDVRRAAAELGWQPTISTREGISRLLQWVQENRALFA